MAIIECEGFEYEDTAGHAFQTNLSFPSLDLTMGNYDRVFICLDVAYHVVSSSTPLCAWIWMVPLVSKHLNSIFALPSAVQPCVKEVGYPPVVHGPTRSDLGGPCHRRKGVGQISSAPAQ